MCRPRGRALIRHDHLRLEDVEIEAKNSGAAQQTLFQGRNFFGTIEFELWIDDEDLTTLKMEPLPFDAMLNPASAKVIGELAREKLTRWSPEEVEKARKVLFGEADEPGVRPSRRQ